MNIFVHTYDMFSSVVFLMGSCPEFSWSVLEGAGPPLGPLWALVGRALAGQLGLFGPGPCGPPWVLVGSPGPLRAGPL